APSPASCSTARSTESTDTMPSSTTTSASRKAISIRWKRSAHRLHRSKRWPRPIAGRSKKSSKRRSEGVIHGNPCRTSQGRRRKEGRRSQAREEARAAQAAKDESHRADGGGEGPAHEARYDGSHRARGRGEHAGSPRHARRLQDEEGPRVALIRTRRTRSRAPSDRHPPIL